MITDVIKTIYLLLFSTIFNLFKMFPVKRKIVMYVTFRQNAHFITQEFIKRDLNTKLVLVCNKSSYERLETFKSKNVQLISLDNNMQFLKRVYHLATARVVIVDNYFPFLAVTNFKKNVECIQVWHAAGAIKSFGLLAHNTYERTGISLKRFRSVYQRFDKIIVGSDEMAGIFEKAFGVNKDVFLKTGVPRTDLFFSNEEKNRIRSDFLRNYPQIQNKKVVLYAPTFRDNSKRNIDLDLDAIIDEIGNSYYFIIKLHPVMKQSVNLNKKYKHSVLMMDNEYDVNELLHVTDILVSDYSSIPFEFCLLNKPMIFFAFDLIEYIEERGVWKDYRELVPGPVVLDTQSLIKAVKNAEESFNPDQLKNFCSIWNKYSTGNSSKNLIDYIAHQLK